MSILVQNAIDVVVKIPRPIQSTPLGDWKFGTHRGRPYVRWNDGIPCYYRPECVPAYSKDIEPVFSGTTSGKFFVIDGAHRLTSYFHAEQQTIPAVVLTEVETRS